MLYQVEFNSTISKNILNAFRKIHARKVYHGDVRVENILVRPDNSVVIIDFERSIVNANQSLLKEEMKEIKLLLSDLQKE
jgi:RIO-like serine/threonine protein kinase